MAKNKGSHKPTAKETWDETKKFQESKGDKPDSTKDFREAEHDARDDAAGTPDEVRPAK